MRTFNLKAKKTRSKTPEGAVLSQVRDYLRLKGWYVIRNQQGLGSHKGLSDLMAVSKQGRVVFIEIKAPEHISKAGHKIRAGNLSEDQEKFFFEMGLCGIQCCTVRSVTDAEDQGL
jgi:hypothetical protein